MKASDIPKVENKIVTISLIPRHWKYLQEIKIYTGITKAETIRRALDLFIGSSLDPLVLHRNDNSTLDL